MGSDALVRAMKNKKSDRKGGVVTKTVVGKTQVKSIPVKSTTKSTVIKIYGKQKILDNAYYQKTVASLIKFVMTKPPKELMELRRDDLKAIGWKIGLKASDTRNVNKKDVLLKTIKLVKKMIVK